MIRENMSILPQEKSILYRVMKGYVYSTLPVRRKTDGTPPSTLALEQGFLTLFP
jgi:hypothetical protein